MTSEKTDAMSMSLDQYIQESNFYFSPYGDINLVNHAKKDAPQPSTSRAIDENRDILDLNPNSDIADELSNIIKELDNAGNAATIKNHNGTTTLNGMILEGKVKGLPRGTKPEVGLEEQGFKLPIQAGNNNHRFNPLQRPSSTGLKSKLQALQQRGAKTKNANFKRLPNVGLNRANPWQPWAPGYRFQGNHQQQLVPRAHAPPLIRLELLNSLSLDTNALRDLMHKNERGGLHEYLHTVSANLGSKYDMHIQREIADKQKKALLETENGFMPISVDGPGFEEGPECLVLGTATTLNSRFSAI